MAHLPIVLYAAFLEFFGWICPLTPLEKFLRVKGGGITYQTGFIDHYIVPIIYPSLLTHQMKIMLGIAVLILNISIYLMIIWYRTKKKRKKLSSGA